jgi:hypothetical protein
MAQNIFGLVHTLLDNAGAIEVGGTIEVYDAGTTTPRTLYSDRALTTTAGTSITADAAGRFPERWIADELLIKLVYKDVDGATLATRDYANDVSSISTDDINNAGLIRAFATYAAMTAADVVTGVVCRTLSYDNILELNDGSSGVWLFVSTSTRPANGGTILAHDSGTGRFFRLQQLLDRNHSELSALLRDVLKREDAMADEALRVHHQIEFFQRCGEVRPLCRQCTGWTWHLEVLSKTSVVEH